MPSLMTSLMPYMTPFLMMEVITWVMTTETPTPFCYRERGRLKVKIMDKHNSFNARQRCVSPRPPNADNSIVNKHSPSLVATWCKANKENWKHRHERLPTALDLRTTHPRDQPPHTI